MALLRFTDKQYILRNAVAKLKDHSFQGANLFISDDVSSKVRDNRRKLKGNHLEAIRAHEDVEFLCLHFMEHSCLYAFQKERHRQAEIIFSNGFR